MYTGIIILLYPENGISCYNEAKKRRMRTMAQLTYKKLTAEDVPAYLDLLKKMAKFEELDILKDLVKRG